MKAAGDSGSMGAQKEGVAYATTPEKKMKRFPFSLSVYPV
jgi:hypothetical protein